MERINRPLSFNDTISEEENEVLREIEENILAAQEKVNRLLVLGSDEKSLEPYLKLNKQISKLADNASRLADTDMDELPF